MQLINTFLAFLQVVGDPHKKCLMSTNRDKWDTLIVSNELNAGAAA